MKEELEIYGSDMGRIWNRMEEIWERYRTGIGEVCERYDRGMDKLWKKR